MHSVITVLTSESQSTNLTLTKITPTLNYQQGSQIRDASRDKPGICSLVRALSSSAPDSRSQQADPHASMPHKQGPPLLM